MAVECFWWSKDGYYPFEPGKDGYPHAGQVVWFFRKKKIVDAIPFTQADLAKALGISEKSVWAMENTNVGLDSFKRRIELVILLDIPPVLLKLDAAPVSEKSSQQCPGQVIREYRKKKKKENGSSWTQTDLAELLDISEKSVCSMENHNVGLDSLSRRTFLTKILDIPPVLLGLDALHVFEEGTVQKTAEPRIPKKVSLNQEKLALYEISLSSYWELQYTNTAQGTISRIEKIIHDLRIMVPYVSENHQKQLKELLCHYHQLALDVARDQGNYALAFAHADLAVTLAENLRSNELLAVALYRRGLASFHKGDLFTASSDLDNALPYARYARPQVKGMVLMEAGHFRAHIAQSSMDKMRASKLLDQAESMVRCGELGDDTSFVKLDIGRYHIGKAATLLALAYPTQALEELDEAELHTRTVQTRRRIYIDILRARAYYCKGKFPMATGLAIGALQVCQAINSGVNIAYISELYHQLIQTSFGNSLDVVQLGLKLGSRK